MEAFMPFFYVVQVDESINIISMGNATLDIIYG